MSLLGATSNIHLVIQNNTNNKSKEVNWQSHYL